MTTDDFSRYESINPKRFQVGDIVEAEVSFMLVPTKGKLYQFVSVLRSIALFDNKLTRVRLFHSLVNWLKSKDKFHREHSNKKQFLPWQRKE